MLVEMHLAGSAASCPWCGRLVSLPPIAQRAPRSGGEPLAFHSKVAGVSYANNDGTERQTIIVRCRIGETLTLRRFLKVGASSTRGLLT
jgi:hypothetical protein